MTLITFNDSENRTCFKIGLGLRSPIAIELLNRAIWTLGSANENRGMPIFTSEGMFGTNSHRYVFIDQNGELYLGIPDFYTSRAGARDGLLENEDEAKLVSLAKIQLINMLKALHSLNDAAICAHSEQTLTYLVTEGQSSVFYGQDENNKIDALIKYLEGKPLSEREHNLIVGRQLNAFEFAQFTQNFQKYTEAFNMKVHNPGDYTKKSKAMSRAINAIFKLLCLATNVTEREARGACETIADLFDIAFYGGVDPERDALVKTKIEKFKRHPDYEALTKFIVKK